MDTYVHLERILAWTRADKVQDVGGKAEFAQPRRAPRDANKRLRELSRESCCEARRSAFPIDEVPSGEDCCLRMLRRKPAVIFARLF